MILGDLNIHKKWSVRGVRVLYVKRARGKAKDTVPQTIVYVIVRVSVKLTMGQS